MPPSPPAIPTPPGPTVAAILEFAREVLGLDFGYVAEFVGGAQVTRAVTGAAASFGQGTGVAVPLEETYCRRMVDGELEHAIPDAVAHPVTRALPITDEAGIGAYVGVPVELPGGRLYGTLCCLHHEATPLDERDVRLLRLLARLVARVLASGEHLGDRAGEVDAETRLLAALRERDHALGQTRGELRRSREQLQAVIDHGPSVIVVKDLDGRYLLVNREHERLFGVRQEDVLGRRDGDLFAAAVAERLRAGDRAVLEGARPATVEEVLPVAGEERTFMATRFALRDADGAPYAICAIATDVTERRRAEEALRASERRTRAILDGAQDAFVSIDVEGRITDWNPEAERTFGHPRAEVVGRPLGQLIIPDRLRASHDRGMARLLATGEPSVLGRRLELPARHRDGHEFPVEMTISMARDDAGTSLHAFLHDISERKDAEAALAHQALHDPLTGLPNRALLLDRLARSLARARRRGDRCAVLFVDVDDFKLVNDSLGHERGDELLLELSARLAELVRTHDTVARLGGDEFVLVLEGLPDDAEALAVAGRVRAALATPFVVAGQRLAVRASVGVAVSDGSARGADLIRDADTAMYRAKDGGGGTHALFDDALREEAAYRLAVHRELRDAVAGDQLRLHLQPIVAVADGAVVGAEALVRWQHPEHGLLGPARFVGVAEKTGLIVDVGAWVLRSACREAVRWPEAAGGPLRVSVNVSARQLIDPAFVMTVADALAESGLPAHRLVLELTETALLDGGGRSRETLVALREVGVGLALDDFGTGYSSLSYLHELPFDVLKLDRSFVGRIEGSARARAVIRAVVQLAAELELHVVAEGIETAAQQRSVHELGCGLAQGYLFSRPRPAAELGDWLGERARATGVAPERR